jgi:inner membrane protein
MTENKKSSFWNSITVKLVIIGFLTLLLLIPGGMLKNLIEERQDRRDEVITEINSKWGDSQTLTGPIISIPYKKYHKEDDEVFSTLHHAHFLPEELNINGKLIPETRYRGIYKVVVYNTLLNFAGNFKKPDFESWNINEKNIIWEDAMLYLGIPDMRGINKSIKIELNDKKYNVNPGIPVKDLISTGVHTPIKISEDTSWNFHFELDLNGSESLNFIPAGKTTTVKLKSGWTNPSFDGSFLPDDRNIDEDGFTADWKVLHLNRNFPQKWLDKEYSVDGSDFGTKLLIPVDHYQKSYRSVKYAIMFIALTFITFFFSEILNKKKIHPIQYLLTGLSISIFYTLLISLSEHIGFNYSYLISSVAIIVLIASYYHSVVRKRKATLIITILLIVLYVFLFTIIQLQEYSLLMGSIGLFIVMAAIMYLSRNIDWYAPMVNKEKEAR